MQIDSSKTDRHEQRQAMKSDVFSPSCPQLTTTAGTRLSKEVIKWVRPGFTTFLATLKRITAVVKQIQLPLLVRSWLGKSQVPITGPWDAATVGKRAQILIM